MGTPSSRFEDEIDKDYQEWQKKIKNLEKKILKKCERDLQRLAAAGIDRETLLRLLALAAVSDASWELAQMRRSQAALKSLSERLRTMAHDTESVVNSPLSVLRFWHNLTGAGMGRGLEGPKTLSEADPGVSFIVTGMTALAEKLKRESENFGLYLRRFGQADTRVVLLLARCWMFRIKAPDGACLLKKGQRVRLSMDCLDELANLLTDAFEVAGKTKVFSADGLRMTFKRHARRVILQWLKPDPQPAKAEIVVTPLPKLPPIHMLR